MPDAFRVAPAIAPATPRELTRDLAESAAVHGRFLRLFGAIWGGVGLALCVVFGVLALTAVAGLALGTALGALFAMAGGLLWAIGSWQRARARGIYRDGAETRGEIVEVFQDPRVRMNGRHPWRVVYEFLADGKPTRGTATFWDLVPPQAAKGDPVVVLHTAGQSVLWTHFEPGALPQPRRVRVPDEEVVAPAAARVGQPAEAVEPEPERVRKAQHGAE